MYYLRSASGVFTNQLTFGLGTKWLRTLPVAIGLGTYRFALGFGRLAVGYTVGGFANVHAFRAVCHFASFVRAHRSAVRANISIFMEYLWNF